MRILHTADWHLGDRLGRIDRTADLRVAVERVADYCKAERADVLLVAGDLFSELARPESLRETIGHWQEVFRGFLEGGGTILALTGNHDSEGFCRTLVHAMSLAAPTSGQPGETVLPGRLYLATDPTFVRLRTRADAFDVQFVLMPYPTPRRYLKGDTGQKYASADEKNRHLTAAWNQALDGLRADPRFDSNAPTVMSAHVHAYGSQIGPSLFRMSDEEDVIVTPAQWAEWFDYAALGHIHKPQALGGASHVRYSGSIERMDLGEQADQKGVVLFELGPEGLTGEPQVLPLAATPIYELTVRTPAEDLPRLMEEYADAKQDLVNLHITYRAGEDSLEDVLTKLGELFPRWYARDWQEANALGPSLVPADGGRGASFGETVRRYLEQELIQHPEADRDAVLKLADELLQSEE